MVGRWQVKNPLNLDERRKIKEAIDLNLSYREIGIYVGRPKTTVRKEAIRLGKYTDYDPDKAQRDFEEKQMQKFSNTKTKSIKKEE